MALIDKHRMMSRLAHASSWLAAAFCLLHLACSDDSEYKYHVTKWDGAFFMDSVTLGVVGWEFDLTEPAGAWGDFDFENINQYLYRYHLNEDRLERVAVLQEDAGFYTPDPSVAYAEPWVVYGTFDTSRGLAIYNVETGTCKQIARGDFIVSGLSESGDHVCYYNRSSHDSYLHSVPTNQDVSLPAGYFWFSVDDSLALLGTTPPDEEYGVWITACRGIDGPCDSAAYVPHWKARLTSTRTHVVSLLPLFGVAIMPIGSVYAGASDYDTLPEPRRLCDYHSASGFYVYESDRDIWCGTAYSSREPVELLPSTREDL